MELQGQNIIVFDCEIKHEIDGKIVTWATHHKMGVSVAVAHHYKTGDTKVYLDDNLTDLYTELNAADMVVGFNTLGFDVPLLNATRTHSHTGEEIIRPDVKLNNHYDMLYWSRRATGWNTSGRFPSGLKLDEHLKHMFCIEKTEDGADAPKFYQGGKMGRLISYCIADVARERKLFEHIWDFGFVSTATHGKRIIQSPREILKQY